MKDTVKFLAAALLVGMFATSVAYCAEPASMAGADAVPVIQAAPPAIDGVLDDPAWKTAMVFDSFKLPDGSATKGHARMLVAQDSKNLYIAVESFEKPEVLKSLLAVIKEHDGAEIWADDDIEISIDPSNLRKDYYQIAVNSKGVTSDAYFADPTKAGTAPDLSWNPTYKSAAKVGDKSWVVELALPWSIFDSTPRFATDCAFNALVMRQENDDIKRAEEESWFAPIKGSSRQPAKFGTLHGIIGTAPTTIVERQSIPEKKDDPTTQPWFSKYEPREFTGSDGKVLLYRIIRPSHATASVKTPTLVYLHGSGRRGDNNIDQINEFYEQFLEAADKYNALVIVPQCPIGTGWVLNASQASSLPATVAQTQPVNTGRQSRVPLKMVLELLPTLEKEFNLDTDRLYIWGGSMGAMGVWTMLDAYPDMFAAAVIRSGRGDPSKVPGFAHVPVWISHGEKDKTVPVSGARNMVAAIKKAGGNPHYNEYPGLKHAGNPVDPGLLPWLFEQRKSAQVKLAAPASAPATSPAK